MRIAIVTFDGFNEIDSFVTLHILNRVDLQGWKAEITSPAESVASLNGVRIAAQQPIEFANSADAVVFGSGRMTSQVVADDSIMSRLHLDPERQLIAAQCSGVLALLRLGILRDQPVCTDLRTKPLAEEAGLRVLNEEFHAKGNIATAGGCLASPYLASWLIWRLLGQAAAEKALRYVAPVGDKSYIPSVLAKVGGFVTDHVGSATG